MFFVFTFKKSIRNFNKTDKTFPVDHNNLQKKILTHTQKCKLFGFNKVTGYN